MQKLADQGNGNYAYIDTEKEATKVLVDQMSGTLVTIAKDVKIQIEFNPAKVGSYRLIGYEKRLLAKEDFNDDKKDAGEIGAGHTVTALYEVAPVGEKGDQPVVDPLKYGANSLADAQRQLLRLQEELATLQRELDAAATKNVTAERDKYAQLLGDKEQELAAQSKLAGPGNDDLLTLKLRYKSPDAPLAQGTSKLIEFPVKDSGRSYAQATPDFKFAAAVASFGMILHDSQYKGAATFAAALELAREGVGADTNGYRQEFIGLVEKAKELSPGK